MSWLGVKEVGEICCVGGHMYLCDIDNKKERERDTKREIETAAVVGRWLM